MSGNVLFAIEALLAAAAGFGVGLAYFGMLARNLDLYLEGRPVSGAALQAGRLVVVAGILLAAVQFGAVPLLACAAGLLMARHVVLRRHKRQVP